MDQLENTEEKSFRRASFLTDHKETEQRVLNILLSYLYQYQMVYANNIYSEQLKTANFALNNIYDNKVIAIHSEMKVITKHEV